MALTGREAGPLVASGKLDVEVGHQCMHVVIPLHLQAEGGGEGQVLHLDCVDVHLLPNGSAQSVLRAHPATLHMRTTAS